MRKTLIRVLHALVIVAVAHSFAYAVTVRTVTVKPSGGDYTTLNAAFAGEVGNLVSLDRQLDIVCDAFSDTTMANTGAGWTTDATRFVRVKAAAGAENKGIKDQGYHVTGDGNRGVLSYISHLRFEDIQIAATSGGIGLQQVADVGDIRVDRCYVIGLSNEGIRIPARASGSGTLLVRNSVVVGGLSHAATSLVTLYVYNCVILGNTTEPGPNTAYYKNVIFGSGGDLLSYGGDGASVSVTNCASDETLTLNAGTGWGYYQVDGGGNRSNQTFTFVDAANGNYHLASNDAGALDYGTDLSGDATWPFSGDIDGVTRTGTWDIGADEYVADGGGSSGPIRKRIRIIN